MKANVEKYLIEGGRPLIVIPELAKEIGIDTAIVLQQLHWLLRDEKNGKVVQGKRWLYNTYEEWQGFFPWVSVRNIRRIFVRLEELTLVESCQPEGGISRRKYYRLTVGGTAHQPCGQNGRIERPNGTHQEPANLDASYYKKNLQKIPSRTGSPKAMRARGSRQ